jgi:hypothetical protein
VIGAIIIVAVLVVFIVMKQQSSKKAEKQTAQVSDIDQAKVATNEEKSAAIQNEKKVASVTEDTNVIPFDESANQLQSENFKLDNVRFGSDASLLVDQSENMPIEIFDVKNEAFLNKKGDESKVIISWKSNKLTLADVAYSKNNGQNPKTFSEGNFGFSHSVVISGLELGTGYIYKIKSTDHWNNKHETDFFGFYSGLREDSIFELIGKEFKDIFGWAMN